MDPELLKLIDQAVTRGVTATSAIIFLVGLLGATLGAFLGSYLKKSGELLATKEKFDEILKQVEAQTKVTEEIKGNIAKETAGFTEELRTRFTTELEILRTNLRVTAHQRETRFSEWYGHQTNVLSELYTLLSRAEQSMRPTIPNFGPQPIEESFQHRENLRTYAEENAVFIPDQISEDLNYLQNRLSQVLLRRSRGDKLSANEEEIMQEILGTELPQLRSKIKDQIFILLGGETADFQNLRGTPEK
jgi:hypothetical protein